MQTGTIAQRSTIEAAQQTFITKVYGWMTVALITTGLLSYYVIATPGLLATIIKNPIVFYGLIFGELGLVIGLSAAIQRMSAMVATGCFFLYAALTGVTISVIFVAYTRESIATTFFITAGTFGAMSFYGYVTKRDLTKVGQLAIMALIGIIIASVVNMFFKSSAIAMVTSYIGVIVFVALTAYDTQKIKQMGPAFKAGSEEERKGAIMGALALYLDFINLFLMLLRIFGRRR